MPTDAEPSCIVEIVTGTVVAPTHVATPKVAPRVLLIGAFTGSDETHVGSSKYCACAHPGGSAVSGNVNCC
jgi:hypothetical protein